MTTASSSAGLPLRQLRWPALPAVDLLEECHWLVNMEARNANPARKPQPIEEQARHKLDLLNEIPTKELRSLSKQKSPYRQPLRRPKPPAPSPGSPAQRAAKSILKLKEGLLRLDDTNRARDIQGDTTTIVALAQQQGVQQPVIGSSAGSTPISIDSSLTSLGTCSARSPSPSTCRAKTPIRSPSRKKKKRTSTCEERELAEKQERLAAWLNANPDASPAKNVGQDARRRLLVDSSPIDAAPPYSMEVEARIESAMQCHGPLESGVGLWDDPVRSLLAAEMTSELVFGGAVPTRALAFQPASPSRIPGIVDAESSLQVSPPKQLSTDNNAQSLNVNVSEEATSTENDHAAAEDVHDVVSTFDIKTEMSDHTQKVFDVAHRQVADGTVADALATLEAGIRQSLSNSQAHQDAVGGSHEAGFNYSVLAHKSATKLQLCYRARHRRRVNRLILLQRQWRWWHARRRMLSSVQYGHKQAMVIQRCYRPWHSRITHVRGAVRIQRCFRLFKNQKFLIRFRQVCRLLVDQQVRRRQVKTRTRMIGKFVLLLRRRRRRIALIQGLWRRYCARSQLASLLAHVSAVELGRRAREDKFIAVKLDQTHLRFREFLRNTKRGRELVRWQAEKTWLRFRRLRNDTKQWDELSLYERIDAVAGVLSGCRFRGLHLRALCQMLVGKDKQLPSLPKVLQLSTDELAFLVNASTISNSPKLLDSVGFCPWLARIREKTNHTRTKLSRRASTLWWTIVTYPMQYCAAQIWPTRMHRRDQARQQLEDDFTRVLTAFLRVWFRRIDSKTNTPPYACEWCSEPFGTSREFFAHGKCAAARTRAEEEWTALRSDLEFARRKKWRHSKQPLDNPVRTDIQTFDLEAASVRRLRRTHSRREALLPLVATLESCTTDDNVSAVIPLSLAGFVLQFLDDNKNSHPLVQTAEHQLVRWSTLVGSMEVESSRQTPEGSGFESRWIRQDELRSRLIVGSEWRGILSRWRRRALKYRSLPAFRQGSKTAQDAPMSPSVAGTRVLPVST